MVDSDFLGILNVKGPELGEVQKTTLIPPFDGLSFREPLCNYLVRIPLPFPGLSVGIPDISLILSLMLPPLNIDFLPFCPKLEDAKDGL